MKPEFELFDRRGFFGAVTKTAAMFGLVNAVASKAKAEESVNPFAYDLSRFQKTDPKLIRYTEIARWPLPQKNARRISIGTDDQIYLCAGNFIHRLSKGQSNLQLEFSAPACCVGTAKDGTIFAGLRDHIEVFDAKGNKTAVWASPDPKSWFTGIAVDEQNIFVADSRKLAILRYDHSGKIIGQIGRKDHERNVPGLIVPSPFLDVAIHRDGLLRVNNPGRHCVESYTANGDLEQSWGKPGAAIESFCGCCNPIALTTLADGRVLTCEKGIPRVKIYTSAGQLESVVAGAESFPENAHACTDLNDCVHGGLDAVAGSDGLIYILDIVTNDIRVMRVKA